MDSKLKILLSADNAIAQMVSQQSVYGVAKHTNVVISFYPGELLLNKM
ncbi:MAG: hypothetical protein ACYSWS_00180 [Planctomycetota bacterium]|jgi:hypothetical protein